MDNYPNNSHKAKNDSRARDVKPVITGRTEIKKNNKFLNAILSDSFSNIKSNLVSDVLVPIVIKTISDIGHNTLDVILGGRGDPRRRSTADRYSWREPISYENRYRNNNYRYERDIEPTSYNYTDIIYYSKQDAINVLKGLNELLCRYHVVTILDLYDLSGRGDESKPTDNKYGWDNLRSAHIEPIGNRGWYIDLPKAQEISEL